jgi:hypothetical protein
MTGAGSLSPSPQPVTKTLGRALTHWRASSFDCCGNLHRPARELFDHRPGPVRLRIAAPKFAQEQNVHRLRDASRFQIGGSIDEGPFRKAISGIFATWALFVRAPRSDLLSEVPLSHSRSVRMLALLMALQRRLRTPPLFMVCSGERQEVGDRVCCYNSPDGSW